MHIHINDSVSFVPESIAGVIGIHLHIGQYGGGSMLVIQSSVASVHDVYEEVLKVIGEGLPRVSITNNDDEVLIYF